MTLEDKTSTRIRILRTTGTHFIPPLTGGDSQKNSRFFHKSPLQSIGCSLLIPSIGFILFCSGIQIPQDPAVERVPDLIPAFFGRMQRIDLTENFSRIVYIDRLHLHREIIQTIQIQYTGNNGDPSDPSGGAPHAVSCIPVRFSRCHRKRSASSHRSRYRKLSG